MSVSEDKLNWDVITFAALCRENTGRAMCDSGDHYGRAHEKPEIPEDGPEILRWDKGCSATLETSRFLAGRLAVDRNLQRDWQRFDGECAALADALGDCPEGIDYSSAFADWADGKLADEDSEAADGLRAKIRAEGARCRSDLENSWFESAALFMRTRGFVCVARGNTCNGENDLSQNYVWEVWLKPDEDNRLWHRKGDEWVYHGDWMYRRDAAVAVYTHNGCDVRGGYSRPLFCSPGGGDYCIPFDLCAEYAAEPVAYPKDGPDIDFDHYQSLDETWRNGYSSWPYGRLEEDVAEWHEGTRDRDSVEVTLRSGERIRVRALPPYSGN